MEIVYPDKANHPMDARGATPLRRPELQKIARAKKIKITGKESADDLARMIAEQPAPKPRKRKKK